MSQAVTSPTVSNPRLESRRTWHQRVWQWLNHREADVRFVAPTWLAWLSVLIVVCTYGYVAWTADGPAFAPDEVGMAGAAQVIAHGSTGWTLAGSGYMPGLAILVAPAWWFTDNSFVVYDVGLAIGVALSALTIWPLSLIARRLGITSRPASVVVASVIMLFPARTLPANYLLAEALLTLITAATFAVAYRIADKATVGNSALLGTLVGLAFLAHGRAIALVAAAGVWILILAGRRWRLLAAFAVSVSGVSIGAWVLYRYIGSQLYWNDQRLANTFDSVSHESFTDFLGFVAGVAWYTMVAWPAIAIVGGLVIFTRGRSRTSPELFLVISMVTAIVLAFIQLKPGISSAFPRLDLWIYGRYMDHLFTVLALIGLAILVRVRHRGIPVAVLALSLIVGTAFMLVTVPLIPVGGFWVDVHVAGMSHYLSWANFLDGLAEPWLLITASAVAIGVLVAVLGWMRFVLPVLAVLALTLSLVTDTVRVDPRNHRGRVSPEINDPLAPFPEDEPVAFNVDYGLRINLFAFAANPRRIVPVTLEEASREYSVIYTEYQDDSPAEYGAKKMVEPRVYYSSSLWVFPGPLFDELETEGLLQDAPEQ